MLIRCEKVLKNYILWPILALLSTMAIYLVLVGATYKILSSSPYMEELLWRYSVSKDLLGIYGDERGKKLQSIVDNLPVILMPHQYAKVTILITQDDEINAFAAPGGRIILTTGLLESVKSENALLFVIGHEIAHLDKQDHLYEFSRTLVSNLYGILTLSDLLPEMLMLIDGSKTKDSEFLADQRALKMILQHYRHVAGADEFFNVLLLQENNRKMHYSLLSTHPTVEERLNKINGLIKENKL
jgi:beta-barrel assembly-enhancing protease